MIACIHKDCGQGFASREEMISHMTNEPNHAQLTCSYCRNRGEFFAGRDLTRLASHVINKHNPTRKEIVSLGSDPAKFWCEICNSAFCQLPKHYASKAHDPAHLALMTADQRARHWCQQCERYYPNLGEHRKCVHERPFSCPVEGCEYVTGHLAHLRKHLRLSVHNIPDEAINEHIAVIREMRAKLTGRTITSMVRRRHHTNLTNGGTAQRPRGLLINMGNVNPDPDQSTNAGGRGGLRDARVSPAPSPLASPGPANAREYESSDNEVHGRHIKAVLPEIMPAIVNRDRGDARYPIQDLIGEQQIEGEVYLACMPNIGQRSRPPSPGSQAE